LTGGKPPTPHFLFLPQPDPRLARQCRSDRLCQQFSPLSPGSRPMVFKNWCFRGCSNPLNLTPIPLFQTFSLPPLAPSDPSPFLLVWMSVPTPCPTLFPLLHFFWCPGSVSSPSFFFCPTHARFSPPCGSRLVWAFSLLVLSTNPNWCQQPFQWGTFLGAFKFKHASFFRSFLWKFLFSLLISLFPLGRAAARFPPFFFWGWTSGSRFFLFLFFCSPGTSALPFFLGWIFLFLSGLFFFFSRFVPQTFERDFYSAYCSWSIQVRLITR